MMTMNGGLRKFSFDRPDVSEAPAVEDDSTRTRALLEVFKKSAEAVSAMHGEPGSQLQNAINDLLTGENLLERICAVGSLNEKARTVFTEFHDETMSTVRKFRSAQRKRDAKTKTTVR